ncbi:chordin [Octopus vulgaris]|uniref:Chordin n=2 Tax=Octopus TaxID=6643 RepID=A0AA36AV69_OCTVU|nr:chordin [Octopus vulgaris]
MQCSCNYNGKHYDIGSIWYNECNKCQCTSDGRVDCEQKTCDKPCTYKGKTYSVGEIFKDDCNACRCGQFGRVVCTKMYCPPTTCQYYGKTYKNRETFMAQDKCNVCRCTNGKLKCTNYDCYRPRPYYQ